MPKKRVSFPVYVQAVYDGELDIPDGVESYEEIENYIKDHLNDVELGPLEYIPESDEFDPECDIDIYYYPTEQEEIELDGMKYRLIKKCDGFCRVMDHGMPYSCPLYPLCKKHNHYREPNGNINEYLGKFEVYEIRDAYADIHKPFASDEMSYERKRNKVKEYCDHKDFLHCKISGICQKNNHKRNKDCYDITDDLRYKWSHKDIDEALKIIDREEKVTKL